MDLPKVFIRKFQPGDEDAIRRLLSKEAMTVVCPFFLSAAGKESVVQCMLMLAAALFVVVGTSFLQSLLAVPIVLAALYLSIYAGHRMRAFKARRELEDIGSAHPEGSRKGFWVAVLVNPESVRADAPRDYTFYSEDDADVGSTDLAATSRCPDSSNLVGTVAIGVKHDPDMKEPPGSVAVLKSMAVSPRHQKRGIGTALLDACLEHCLRQKFRAVELSTTEYHQAARALYAKRGFETMGDRSKAFLGGIVSLRLMELRVACSTLLKSKS